MCGVVVLLNLDGAPADRAIVTRMTDTLIHRGPDGGDVLVDGAVGLGHRRLAIIDLSDGGRQPMTTADGRFTLAYNGEVYNFRELRRELEADGVQFRSRSDSEVVLAAWAAWGEAAVERFNGMFAFAVWDRQKRELALARDRYGIKPIYLASHGNSFLVASEIKALLAHPAVSAELDPAGLTEYMTFQNFFTERTLFAGIELLAPATVLRIDQQSGRIQRRRYWDWNFFSDAGDGPASEAEYVEELDRRFRKAVERQIVSDVPVGAYLSGGIDSGSITAVASPQIPNLRTFTVGFDLHSASGLELSTDERATAEHMSYLFKTEHYEMVLKAGDMERALPQMTYHLEVPRVGQSYPNFYAAKLAGQFGKVVLSGTGGDEIFGGYPWRYYRAVVNDSFDHYVDKYHRYWQRLVPGPDLMNLLRPLGPVARETDTREIFRNVFSTHAAKLTRPHDYINHSLYFEAKTFLQGLLAVEDKLSMAHGLETRVPFLDNDLVDFAMRIPVDMKLGNLGTVIRLNENEPGKKTRRYFERTQDGKLIMRKMAGRYIPEHVAEAAKQGFSAPDASWFRGESIDFVRRKILNPRAKLYDVFDRDTVVRLLSDHLEGRENRRLLIWSFLQIEEWLGTFLDRSNEAWQPACAGGRIASGSAVAGV